MKRTILSLLSLAALVQAADKPDVNAEQTAYLKAIIALQGSQSRQSNFWKDVAQAQAEIEQSIAVSQQGIQKAVGDAKKKCEDKKMVLDEAAVKESASFICIEKPAEPKK